MRDYCTQNNGDCQTCSLVNYGLDCRNNPIREMSELYDKWTGSDSKAEMSRYSFNELLAMVTRLYNSGEEWRQDGAPEQVTQRLYCEIRNR